jgi:hypothetical protein
VGGHAVAEAVKGRLVDAGVLAEAGEAVAQGVGAQVGAPLRARREEPVRQPCGPEPLPGALVRPDKRYGRGTEGLTAGTGPSWSSRAPRAKVLV